MVGRADAGDIVDQEPVPIGPRDSAGEVMSQVVKAAKCVLDRQLDNLLTGAAPRIPQDESQATCFGGRRPEDGRIDWSWPTRRIFNLIRAVTRPYPGAFADLSGGRRLQVWWAEPDSPSGPAGTVLSQEPLIIATGDGALRITEFDWQNAEAPPAAA
jgi:methionyl-tRNA formyltransferase